jgi:hypothetical protein
VAIEDLTSKRLREVTDLVRAELSARNVRPSPASHLGRLLANAAFLLDRGDDLTATLEDLSSRAPQKDRDRASQVVLGFLQLQDIAGGLELCGLVR